MFRFGMKQKKKNEERKSKANEFVFVQVAQRFALQLPSACRKKKIILLFIPKDAQGPKTYCCWTE